MSETIVVERQVTPARLAELGVHGWPTWKDGVGTRTLDFDAAEKSYLLDGAATLSMEDGTTVNVEKGDLVIIPAGKCQWVVLSTVRRHYRSEALSPACCII
ncbi:MAG: hypothetical protein B7Y41_01100 [Hydrogenophilales bacterium 28-61-23]|nr:MAG: hypothetical protein B7Y41_01100 [Hydrogenophilales bacterium 28-61-23]